MSNQCNLYLYLTEVLHPECPARPPIQRFIEKIQNDPLQSLLFALDDPSTPKECLSYLQCSIIIKAESSPDPIGYQSTNKVVESFIHLCLTKRLTMGNYINHLNSIITRELMAAEDLQTIFLFGKIAMNLKNYVNDLSMIDSALDIAFSPSIFEMAMGTDKEKIVEALKALIKAKDLKLDSTGADHAIIENALSWVEDNEDFYGVKASQGQVVRADREGSQVINGLLEKIAPADQEFSDRLNTLKKYGMIEVYDIYKEDYPAEIVGDLPISYQPAGSEITSITAINIDVNPLKTSSTDNRKVFTYIYKGSIKATNQIICIKKIHATTSTQDLSKFSQEAQLMRQLSGKHETFLKFYGSFMLENDLYILMEYVEDNLMEYMLKTNLTELQQIEIAKSLINGFAYLSQRNIYHRDIKPHNILITPTQVPKIIDFGITVFDKNQDLDDNQLKTNSRFVQGTMGYMSPEQKIAYEQFKRDGTILKYGLLHSDVFSLGITLFQMVTGSDVSRYEDKNNNDELKNRINTQIKSDKLKKIIGSMIDKEPSNRKTFIEILSGLGGQTFTIIN